MTSKILLGDAQEIWLVSGLAKCGLAIKCGLTITQSQLAGFGCSRMLAHWVILTVRGQQLAA